MKQKVKIVGLCGSLRKQSFNRTILEFATQQVPKNAEIEIVEIGNLPFFNQDLEENPPTEVVKFREKIAVADGILFAVAEYNYSVSSVLKNAIEWASRPYGDAVINGKTVAMMGASNGMIGSARAQYHLRQMCVQADMYPLNKPEVMVPFGQEKIDEQGNITDEKTKEKISELVQALVNAVSL
jgi:chromate reductase, NAD(P)H dehydrogenase (quinone)